MAVVCALEHEALAAKAVMDEMYSNSVLETGKGGQLSGLKKPKGDPNQYSNGRMGQHDVVVVWINGMGKADASRAASHLHYSYPNVGLVLWSASAAGGR